MPRYKILVEYDGTDFLGWQRQPEGRTVEGEIEQALSQILTTSIDITGQGRTDSGVHAEGQVAHFDYEGELDAGQLKYALLGVLPRDVSVYNIEPVEDDFHARFDAQMRRYRFQIITRPSPTLDRYSQLVLNEINLQAMKECSRMILVVHDFESFTKSGPDQQRTECEILLSKFTRQGHLLIYHIEANRFLRHMVRRLIGTMIQVGIGKLKVDDFRKLLENPSAKKGGHGARAKGLTLEEVVY